MGSLFSFLGLGLPAALNMFLVRFAILEIPQGYSNRFQSNKFEYSRKKIT